MSTSSRGGGGGGRGTGRGRGRGRGNAPRAPQSLVGRGGGTGGGGAAATNTPTASSVAGMASEHVLTTGVKRKAYGQSGTTVKVFTNHYECHIPTAMIHHYDGAYLACDHEWRGDPDHRLSPSCRVLGNVYSW